MRRGEKNTNRRVSVSPDPRVTPSPRPRVTPSPRPRVTPSPHPRVPLVTLLTDFGTSDYFVGAVKGVILSAKPDARIVDLTHEIPAQDIEAAAFTLLAAYRSFPKGTVHIAVVDPGVGSARRGICVAAGEQMFVGPDNGIFSYILDREPGFIVFELTNKKYFRKPVSPTFHGRDIFAPVAAALADGSRPAEVGREITDPVRLRSLSPEVSSRERSSARGAKSGARAGKSPTEAIRGRIIHIDRFGNCITNITPRELTPKLIEAGAHLVVKGHRITSFRSFFADKGPSGKAGRAELFFIWGSAGFLEIAATNRSAAKILMATQDEDVLVKV